MNAQKLSPLVRAKFRVKIRSLADEARIIRHEERKASKLRSDVRDITRNSLHSHRVTVVRDEARATLLAYALLRGVPYKVVEPKTAKELPMAAIQRIVKSLGGWGYGHVQQETIKAWINAVPVKENVA